MIKIFAKVRFFIEILLSLHNFLNLKAEMITFTLSLVALFLGYLVYGKFIEKVFGPDDRVTPAISKADGVDYIVLPGWKIFMIQFLNIAGTGPIFGAIMGAKFGPAAYLWIVFGVYLPVPYTTISRACSPSGTTERDSPNWWENIWATPPRT